MLILSNIQIPKMHILQPKHSKLPEKKAEELLQKLNVSKSQLPKILSSDAALPEGCGVGDIILIERKEEDTLKGIPKGHDASKVHTYWRVVV